jgi:diguanylate cyclase (GGDEF)-like protein/PAS domain S-box-containing protein
VKNIVSLDDTTIDTFPQGGKYQKSETLEHSEPQMTYSFAELKERYLWLEAMVNHIPDFIYAKDREGRFLYANQAIIENNGLSCINDIIGRTDFDLHGKAAENARISEIEQRVIETGEPDLGFEEPALVGGDRWLMMSRVPLRNSSGEIIGVVGTSRDISARKASERLMLAQNRILELIVGSINISLLMKELAALIEGLAEGISCATVIFSTDHEAPMCEAPSVSRLPDELAEALSSASADRIREAMFGLASAHDNFHCFEISSASGRNRGLVGVFSAKNNLNKSLIEFLAGASHMAGIAIDRRQAEERIRFLVDHDALTGVMNRSSIEARLPELLASARQTSQKLAVGFIDIDNFKQVNDTLGHAVGDELLKATAARISEIVGETGMVARIGGDEFIVVLREGQERFDDVFERIRKTVAQSPSADDRGLRTHCSIGIAYFPDHGKTTSDLFKAADLAMYRAKQSGRNNVQAFS